MHKNSKRKFLFMTVFLLTLLSSCTVAALVPNVQAAEATAHQKALTISSDMVGLDLAKYATVEKEVPQDAYMGVIPQENVRYVLESSGSKVDMLYTFANGNIRKIHVLETEGSPQMIKTAANALELAKGFLNDYQAYSANSFYGELKSMLNTVDAGKNLTATSGNTKLEVTAEEDSTTFRWTYTFNGVEAPNKCVALRYKNGFLKYFVDNWNLYKIGSTNINLSEQEAIDIAMARAKTYSWPAGSENNTFGVVKFNVTNAMIIETIFAPSLYADTARSHDLLELFPMRHIWVSLDKFYPGNVYGINVHVWADTKEIGRIQERFSTMDPPADLVADFKVPVEASEDDASAVDKVQSSSWSPMWLAFPAFAAVTLATGAVCLSRKITLRPFNLPKPRVFKMGGVLLCFLVASTVLVGISVSTANAVAPLHGRATVWGSESAGAWNTTLGFSWRKHPDEVSQQRATASFIDSEFALNGYDSSDYQGGGSSKTFILAQISDNEAGYRRVAVVDFDHGVYRNDYHDWNPQVPAGEYHYMFEDNFGTVYGETHPGIEPQDEPWLHQHAVYDMDIAYETTLEKTFFALINTCMSANLTWEGPIQGTDRIQGMPYAWTHRLVRNRDTYPDFNTAYHMSDDGYDRPDNGKFCYIGFDWGSAALNQTIASWPSSPSYRIWLEHFFAWALETDMTVKNALDEASQAWFDGRDFDQTTLYSGFTAMWPMYINGEWNYTLWIGSGPGYMKVYGNGNTKLYQPLLTLSASGGLSPTFTIDGLHKSTGSLRLIADVYTINVSDVPNYDFSYFSYKGGYYTRPVTIQIASDEELTAHYNWNPTYYTLSISSSSGGHTEPSGNQQYLSYTYAHVEAVPDQYWVLECWLLDGQYAGNDLSIDVYMDSPHTLQAVFHEGPLPQHSLTMLAINQYGVPGYVPLYIDGQYVGTTGYTYTVTEGDHQIGVPGVLYYAGHLSVFVAYYYDDEPDYDNPMTLSVTEDKTVYACYWTYS